MFAKLSTSTNLWELTPETYYIRYLKSMQQCQIMSLSHLLILINYFNADNTFETVICKSSGISFLEGNIAKDTFSATVSVVPT